MLAFGKLDDKLFDERGDIAVRDNLAFPFLDVKHRCRHVNLEIAFDLELTAETPAFFDFLAGEVDGLGRQYLAAAFDDFDLALAATALAAAGRRQEYVVVGHCRQKRFARSGLDILVIVDGYSDVARVDEIFFCYKKYYY